jgi:ribosomal protein S27E
MRNEVIFMDVICDNCGYQWDYQGKTQWYLACPKCKNTINISESTENRRGKVKP